MKKIYSTPLFILLSGMLFSQVAIGKQTVSSPSASLEFGDGNKGLLLPWVKAQDVVNAGVVDGTLIYDTTDKKVKLRTANTWKDLSINTSGIVDTSLQDNLTEKPDAKAVIGMNAQTDTTPGILVLTDENKAMVLPKVESPHQNIINPSAGMMVYDTKARQLAVFNGTVWTYWKP